MNNLLIKAHNNQKVALLAEKEEYYDAAVSRYYYSLYEKIIYICLQKNIDTETSCKAGSHEKTIEAFIKSVHNAIEKEKVRYLNAIYSLKHWRTQADYHEKIMIDESQLKMAKEYFNEFDGILDEVIRKLNTRQEV